jgi:hypothetical protein
MMMTTDILERQELRRAHAIIAKAERDELPVVQTLADHFVSARIIEELTGERPDLSRKPKRVDPMDVWYEWVEQHVGETFTADTMAESLGMSVSAARKRINEHRGCFVKPKWGYYTVIDDREERKIAKASA